ncbi:murein hydrolase activator EnvC family protein [Flavobacterium capsici]|uniref:Peptidoglycan DD-metalloendopeptidase family protein n=1 Tax=Flavobacterium capsici TaxID=3075618 RepID=A0AA96EYP7_9FLAO|nr:MULTISPECIES: peptidoglycan DD-metalloendopeptidase family protein [unclassified Flavobacterium]WNM19703.1 peptidoglycan DD-metalloendopeptidase family protein [Flavobacterium sp. PMR2A8]WNM21092.1 peptidoglycan DD-metalloendopeptidase family protein [Flavobacterium sp. PMTSA4]
MIKKIVYIFFLCLTSMAWSQPTKQEQLEERKAKIQQEIQEKQELLNSMKNKEKTVVSQLMIQKEKIGLKEKLIKTTEKQTKLLNDDIYNNQLQINKLNKDLEKLREDYAEMIRKSYKSRSEESRAMFLLSSENFLQAYKRAQYMKQYASYRKAQGIEIKEKTEKLNKVTNEIKVQKSEKEKLIAANEKEKQALEQEKQEQEKIAKQIQKDKKSIIAEIKKKQQETKKIDAQIQKLIREAIAEANRKTAKASSGSKSSSEKKAIENSVNIVLTPEGKIISDNFKSNKGRLPWPVEKGAITLGYGEQPHPVFRTLTVYNSGIEITTESGANAKAVFDGEVSQVQLTSPQKKTVIIKHGDFFTVYNNLSTVNVREGDKVSAREVIGKIRTDGDGKTILKFMISQNTTYFNPTPWLSK